MVKKGQVILALSNPNPEIAPEAALAAGAAFAADGELGRLLGVERDPDEAALRGRLERIDALREEGRFLELAIAGSETDELLGSVTLHSLDWRNRRGEVGFFVVPDARRRGVAQSAVALALDWMFDGLGLDRVEMTTTPDNAAVAALAAALGFAREGLLRSRNLERGARVDVVYFGLMRSEWRAT